MTKYLIAGGGTSGHINPALAVVEQGHVLEAEAEYIFMVTESGIERSLVADAGHKYHVIEAFRLPTLSLSDWRKFIVKTRKGYLKCKKLINEYKPDAIFGTGGYVSVPLLLAAKRMRIPYVIHEQNAFPGKANRFFAGKAAAVCVSFPGTEDYWKKSANLLMTGNPVRSIFFERSRKSARKILGLTEDQPIIVATGGSLGATSINRCLAELTKSSRWTELIEKYTDLKLIIGTGSFNSGEYLDEFASAENVCAEKYIDMSLWLPAADLFVGRAGASSCLEAAASGVPAIFIPFPHAANDHQTANAKLFTEQGAARHLADSELTVTSLADTITDLLQSKETLHSMSQAMRLLAKPQAARDIAITLSKAGRE